MQRLMLLTAEHRQSTQSDCSINCGNQVVVYERQPINKRCRCPGCMPNLPMGGKDWPVPALTAFQPLLRLLQLAGRTGRQTKVAGDSGANLRPPSSLSGYLGAGDESLAAAVRPLVGTLLLTSARAVATLLHITSSFSRPSAATVEHHHAHHCFLPGGMLRITSESPR